MLKSNVEIYLERGATLLASGKAADFQLDPAWKFGEAFITANGAQNIAITGGGTIDGNGRAFVAEDLGYIYAMKEGRPFTFYLVGCSNVRCTIWSCGTVATGRFDSPVPRRRDRSDADFNDLKLPNNDAIDLDHCQNVRVANCHIKSGDDCICLKARPEHAGRAPAKTLPLPDVRWSKRSRRSAP